MGVVRTVEPPAGLINTIDSNWKRTNYAPLKGTSSKSLFFSDFFLSDRCGPGISTARDITWLAKEDGVDDKSLHHEDSNRPGGAQRFSARTAYICFFFPAAQGRR